MTARVPIKRLRALLQLAELQADAARAQLAPSMADRARVLSDLSRLRAVLDDSAPQEAVLPQDRLVADRHLAWCQTRITDRNMALARIEARRAPLAQQLGRAEARRLVLQSMLDRHLTAKARRQRP